MNGGVQLRAEGEAQTENGRIIGTGREGWTWLRQDSFTLKMGKGDQTARERKREAGKTHREKSTYTARHVRVTRAVGQAKGSHPEADAVRSGVAMMARAPRLPFRDALGTRVS